MTKYIVVADFNELFKVEAETPEDAFLKVLYYSSEEETINHIYFEYFAKYFEKKDPNDYPDEEFDECFYTPEEAREMFIEETVNDKILAKHKEIILRLLGRQDPVEYWEEEDPFPWELKSYIINDTGYHSMTAYTEDEITDVDE